MSNLGDSWSRYVEKLDEKGSTSTDKKEQKEERRKSLENRHKMLYSDIPNPTGEITPKLEKLRIDHNYSENDSSEKISLSSTLKSLFTQKHMQETDIRRKIEMALNTDIDQLEFKGKYKVWGEIQMVENFILDNADNLSAIGISKDDFLKKYDLGHAPEKININLSTAFGDQPSQEAQEEYHERCKRYLEVGQKLFLHTQKPLFFEQKGEYPENLKREYIWGTMKQACVTGCLRMLLNDRGWDLKQKEFTEENIAKVLDTNEKTGARMDKAEALLEKLDIGYRTFPDIRMRDLKVALGHKDCDGAALVVVGNSDDEVSHVVLVDQIDNNGNVYIRDPREGAYSVSESKFRQYFLKQAMLPSSVEKMVQERIQERINRNLFGDEKNSQRSSSSTFKEEIDKSMNLLEKYNTEGKTKEALEVKEHINDITSELLDHEEDIRKSLEKRFSKLSLETKEEEDTGEEVNNKDKDTLQDKTKTVIQNLFEEYIADSQNKNVSDALASNSDEKKFTDKLNTDIEKNIFLEYTKEYQKTFKEYKEERNVLLDPKKHLDEEIAGYIKEIEKLEREIKETEEEINAHSLSDHTDDIVMEAYRLIQETKKLLLENNKNMLKRRQKDMEYLGSGPELDQARLKLLEEQFKNRLNGLTDRLKDEHDNITNLYG